MGKWRGVDRSCVDKTTDSQRVYERSLEGPVVILNGPRGIGKKWAVDIVFKMYDEDPTTDGRLNFYEFICTDASKDRITTDLTSLFQTQNLKEIFEKIRNVGLARRFISLDARNLKAQSVPYLLDFLNKFCRELKEEESNVSGEANSGTDKSLSRWTILVPVSQSKQVQPNKYASIGERNFVEFEGFKSPEIERMIHLENSRLTPEECQDYAEKISSNQDIANVLPLAIKLVVTRLTEVKHYPTWDEFVDSCIVKVGDRSIHKKALDDAFRSAVRFIRRSIKGCLAADDVGSDIDKTLMAMVSFMDGNAIPQQLLTAFAEGADSIYGDKGYHNVPAILQKLINGKIVEFSESGSTKYYKTHKLFIEGMGTFLEDMPEKVHLKLQINLTTAFICHIRQDGRILDHILIESYLRQAESFNQALEESLNKLTPKHTKEFRSVLIMLQCELHLCRTKCLHFLGFEEDALSCLKKTIIFYHEGCCLEGDYRRFEYNEYATPSVARKLYQLGQTECFDVDHATVRDFLRRMVQFHVFTPTSQSHAAFLEKKHLDNDHMTDSTYETQRRHGNLLYCRDPIDPEHSGKVVDYKRLGKVLRGELLAVIYHLWAKLLDQAESMHHPSNSTRPDSKLLAWISYDICERVHKDSSVEHQEVFLLQTRISYKTYLMLRLKEARDLQEVNQLWDMLDEFGNGIFLSSAQLKTANAAAAGAAALRGGGAPPAGGASGGAAAPPGGAASAASGASGGAALPPSGAAAPSWGGAAPPRGGTSGAGGGAATPSGGAATPSGGASAAGGRAAPPGGRASAADGGAAPPGGGTSAAGGGAAPSGGGASTAGGGTSAAGGASGGAAAPPSGAAAPPSGAAAPPSGAAALSGAVAPSGGEAAPSGVAATLSGGGASLVRGASGGAAAPPSGAAGPLGGAAAALGTAAASPGAAAGPPGRAAAAPGAAALQVRPKQPKLPNLAAANKSTRPLLPPTFIMERGIVKYSQKEDTYFLVSLLQAKLLVKAKLYAISNQPVYQEEGAVLIKSIIDQINSKYRRNRSTPDYKGRKKEPSRLVGCSYHLEMSKAYRVFGKFHRNCGMSEEAVMCAIKALHYLMQAAGKKYLLNQLAFSHLLEKLHDYANSVTTPFLSHGQEETTLIDDLIRADVYADELMGSSGHHVEKLEEIQMWTVVRDPIGVPAESW